MSAELKDRVDVGTSGNTPMNLALAIERREHARAILRCPVIIETSQGIVEGKTQNISIGGVSILCQAYLRLNEKLYIAIVNVPLLNRHLPVSAEVIRSKESCSHGKLATHGIGLQFVRISDYDREVISALISQQFFSRLKK